MSIFLLAATLAATPAAVESYSSQHAAAVALADKMQTGTLLFNRGDCLAIKVYTNSPYTHVAAVVMEQGSPFVYDSMNGVGVRRLSLEQYLKTQRPDVIHVFQPAKPFSQRRSRIFKNALESELGRPYAVKHHLTGKRSKGLHCSEYVTDALKSTRLIAVQRPPKVSPASLVKGILQAELYQATHKIQVVEPRPSVAKGDNWCDQLWIDTKVCTSRCTIKMRRWFLCH
jgi:hypothetical protein